MPSTSSVRVCAGTRRLTGSGTSRASWTCDLHRCRAAGPGEDTAFATEPEPAARMIGRFFDAGHRVGRASGDEVHGDNPKLRTALEERRVGHVLAVACSHEVTFSARLFTTPAVRPVHDAVHRPARRRRHRARAQAGHYRRQAANQP